MKTPLRFCFVTTFYPPYSFGGDGIDIERLATALVARGHHVTVVYDEDAFESLSDARPAAPAATSIEVIGLKSRFGRLSPLLSHQFGYPVVHGRRLSRLFRDRPFDVVMFHNVSLAGGPGLFGFGGDALKIYLAHEHWLVCPTHVLWRHDREPCSGRQCLRCVLHYRRPPQLWRSTGSLERQSRRIDVFLARSEFSRDAHRRFGFSRPIEIFPSFLPETEASTRDRPHARPYFLIAGRLERMKGIHTVIPAFAHSVDADLVIAGDGAQAEALRALASDNRRVVFLGRVPAAELDRYYHHALAVIAPQLGYETFGLVLIEAMRQGTPVIARRIGPFPEIVGDAGLLYSRDEELTTGLRRLETDEGFRSDLGRRGRERFLERWTESIVLDRYFNILARAARERAAARGGPVPAWVAEAS